jgi:two-component system nitrogen regulation sensor histidine kinase NtrY
VVLAFRHRIFVWLVVIATVPAGIAISVSLLSPDLAAPVGGVEAWERTGDSWREARRRLDLRSLPPDTRRALERHNDELSLSIRRARQTQAFRYAIAGTLAGLAAGLAVLVTGGAVRLAGHLSRQLSRPIDELVDWTGRITRGEALPEVSEAKGAPEFHLLRGAFRRMALDLEAARAREVEAAQLRTFRDIARQVAHELKNPLTPLRFAVARLRPGSTAEQADLLEILDGESLRIEQMARDFSALGRLPEGPPSPVDLGELLASLAKSTVPAESPARIECAGEVPLVLGHYEPLRRAFQNLLLNAVEAQGHGGAGVPAYRRTGVPAYRSTGVPAYRSTGVPAYRRTGVPAGEEPRAAEPGPVIVVALAPASLEGRPAVRVAITDRGPGIAPDAVGRVFEPYFTTKAHGTGLGLAIVRQTILDHGGTITAGNAPGGGAVFTVTLPVERA